MEYKIEIMMTPHPHDSINAPYFWGVTRNNGLGWTIGGFGWVKSPEEAWRRANEYYNSLKENNK